MFSGKDQRRIISKVEDTAAGLPHSLELKTVSRLRGARLPPGAQGAYELRIGRGYRVAFVLFAETGTLRVYLAGTHDYVNRLFLSALEGREGS
jgi:hypothetical protein